MVQTEQLSAKNVVRELRLILERTMAKQPEAKMRRCFEVVIPGNSAEADTVLMKVCHEPWDEKPVRVISYIGPHPHQRRFTIDEAEEADLYIQEEVQRHQILGNLS